MIFGTEARTVTQTHPSLSFATSTVQLPAEAGNDVKTITTKKKKARSIIRA
jgi:hypothetical protein